MNLWNLVANPYAAPIDWDAAGWTKTNVANEVHVPANFLVVSPLILMGLQVMEAPHNLLHLGRLFGLERMDLPLLYRLKNQLKE